jgi:TPR repeat protein
MVFTLGLLLAVSACQKPEDLVAKGDAALKAGDTKGASEAYGQACDQGALQGCVKLGDMEWNKIGATTAEKEAGRDHYAKACDGNLAEGCRRLAGVYEVGIGGGSFDPVKARALMTKACDGGDLEGCDELGNYYQIGSGGPADSSLAFTEYSETCEKGFASACGHAGALYQNDPAPEKQAEGRRLLMKGCAMGDDSSCYYAGTMLIQGQGGPKDPESALAAFKKPCDDGFDAMACSWLGQMYRDGDGVAVDKKKAAELFLKACESSVELACGDLQEMANSGDYTGPIPNPNAGDASPAGDAGMSNAAPDTGVMNAAPPANAAPADGSGEMAH